MRELRTRFWLEVSTCVTTFGLAILTLFNGQWIEQLLGFSPDGGSGAAEWIVVASLVVVGALLGFAGWTEYRRTVVRSA